MLVTLSVGVKFIKSKDIEFDAYEAASIAKVIWPLLEASEMESQIMHLDEDFNEDSIADVIRVSLEPTQIRNEEWLIEDSLQELSSAISLSTLQFACKYGKALTIIPD